MTNVVSVPLPGERSYEIHIGENNIEKVGEIIANTLTSRRVVLISQPPIYKKWGDVVVKSLSDAGFKVDVVCFPAGERFKTLATIERIYSALYQLAPAIDRKTLLVSLGGGVVGDMAGFVAATFLRGLDYIQIPTTLLAMVDSSVGGKTGVDFRAGKNLIGAFYQPRAVVIDPLTLSTLPEREIRSGFAEIVKYGLIQEPQLLTSLEQSYEDIKNKKYSSVTDLIVRSCSIKAAIVAGDEREETGLRAILNYGHTIGHALESATNYRRYKHGEAISIGMISAAFIGVVAGITPSDFVPAVSKLLCALKLPVMLPDDISDELLVEITTHDKKAQHGKARFVLASGLGQVSLHPIDLDVVFAGLRLHREYSKAEQNGT